MPHRTIILLVALCLPTQAATLHVSPGGSGADGLTWPTAFPTLGEAIVASSTEDEIWMASGTYTENLQVVRQSRSLGIAGNPQKGKRKLEVKPTIIDGNRLESCHSENLEAVQTVLQRRIQESMRSIPTSAKVNMKRRGGNRGGGFILIGIDYHRAFHQMRQGRILWNFDIARDVL
ncbi:MAG: hypothetical protein H6752_00640 [Candidatus Omnitrophica bacterium]|nr:hypothetical protein [Candidatus Omnitrophota bacterium]